MDELKPVEIPVKRAPYNWNSHPRRGAGNGLRRARPPLAGPPPPAAKPLAQAATAANQMVLVLENGRHRRFVRAADLAR